MPVVLFCSNGEQPWDTLSPDIIFSLVLALKFYNTTHHRLQSKVSAVLATFQQVAAGPCWHIFNHLYHHICKFKRDRIKDKHFWSFLTLVPIAFTNPQIEEDPPPILFNLLEKRQKQLLTLFLFCDGPSNMPALHLQHNLHKKKLKD